MTPYTEDTFTMLACSACRKAGSAALQQCAVARMFTPMMNSQLASSASASGP